MPLVKKTPSSITSRLRLRGEIVEVLTVKKRPTAKVLLKSCSVEVPIHALADVHLGDCLEFDVEIRLRIVGLLNGGR